MGITSGAIAAWAGFAALVIILLLFVGTAWVPLSGAVLAFSLGLWVTSERRWRSALRFVRGREADIRWADRPWTSRYSLLLVAHGLVWLGLSLLFFLFANIRLASLLFR